MLERVPRIRCPVIQVTVSLPLQMPAELPIIFTAAKILRWENTAKQTTWIREYARGNVRKRGA